MQNWQIFVNGKPHMAQEYPDHMTKEEILKGFAKDLPCDIVLNAIKIK